MTWINAKEKLPENGTRVLIVIDKAIFIRYYEDGKFWNLERTPATYSKLTHWMPLPAPPKQPAYP